MKRILSILLCAMVLITMFIVPLSASADEHNDPKGIWVLNADNFADKSLEGLPTPDYNDQLNNTIGHYMQFNVVGKDELTFDVIAIRIESYFAYLMYGYYENDTLKFVDVLDIATRQWKIEGADVINVHSANNNENVLTLLNYYGTRSSSCDGTSCPATDINEDNICDDCGMPFTMSLRNDTYNYNGVYLPIHFGGTTGINNNLYTLFDYETFEGNIFIIDGDTEEPKLYVFTPSAVVNNGNIVTSQADTEVVLYTVATDEYGTLYWKLKATNEWSNNSILCPTSDVLWSAYNIKDIDGQTVITGDPNFQIPLWETVEKVTQGEIPKFNQTLGGNLMTLTICGVGCLTLLVALVLLYKTLRTYLPR